MTDAVRAKLRGIHAATIVPMREDFAIDEDALAAHIARVAGTPGIEGLLINGHAGENFVLTAAEKRRVVEIARANAPTGCLICSGVNAESSLDLAREAAGAEAAGADLLLVFPPNSWALSHDPGAVLLHHRYALEATSLPLLVYGAPVGAGRMAYTPETLAALLDEPRIIGIKEGSWEVAAYEANLRALKAKRPDFVVLGSGDEHLLTSYIIGSAGSQVSLAALAPELLADLFAAADAGDWVKARAVHERIYPLARAIYREAPGGRATARLKVGLAALGRIPRGTVRPPQPAAGDAEHALVLGAMRQAGVIG